MLPALSQFTAIFAFVIVFAISYGVLVKVDLFEEKSITAIVAAILGIFASFYSPFISIIGELIPFVVILLLFVFVLILFFLFFGVSDDDIAGVMKDESNARTIIGVVAFIFIIVLVKQFGPNILDAAVWSNKYILGIILFFIIAGMTVKLLAYENFVPAK